MINVKEFVETLTESNKTPFFTGVPDSLLQPLCNYLMQEYGISENHVIAANEGNCVGLAAGYHLSTGKTPIVYMQNSGIGNIVNPVASLLNDKVYGIPCIFIVGWRGEPGSKDESQHVFQGEVTVNLLNDLDIDTFVISKETDISEIISCMKDFSSKLLEGKSVAFVVSKGSLINDSKVNYKNNYSLKREDIIKKIVDIAGEDIIISTTGKASRELYEIREQNEQSHKYDFLTVGSMGHSSSIASGIAFQKKNTKIWCIDGDGSLLMHMGAMAVLGANSPNNVVHICINNNSHETVGGLPTVAGNIDLMQIAKGCGYRTVFSVSTEEELVIALEKVKEGSQLTFIEVKSAIGSRADLGRPTTTAKENKESFIEFLKEVD